MPDTASKDGRTLKGPDGKFYYGQHGYIIKPKKSKQDYTTVSLSMD